MQAFDFQRCTSTYQEEGITALIEDGRKAQAAMRVQAPMGENTYNTAWSNQDIISNQEILTQVFPHS